MQSHDNKQIKGLKKQNKKKSVTHTHKDKYNVVM